MRVCQIGNFDPPASTENELRRAMTEGNGWDVVCCQENDPHGWRVAIEGARTNAWDFILWTRTASLSPTHAVQWEMIETAAKAGVPTTSAHLDRWWNLRRENEVRTEPFFRTSHVFTADGGHAADWQAIGVNHHWWPPAVSEFECQPGTPRDDLAASVGFVGSEDYGHREWTHRGEMIAFLRDTYGDRFRTYPGIGKPAYRGDSLRDLYASVDVVVGDSCLVPNADGSPATRYWSDRVPETLGRGGFLIHPWVEGIEVEHPGLPTWRLGEWGALRTIVDWWLDNPEERAAVAAQNRDHVLDRHVYTVRVRQIAQTLGLA